MPTGGGALGGHRSRAVVPPRFDPRLLSSSSATPRSGRKARRRVAHVRLVWGDAFAPANGDDRRRETATWYGMTDASVTEAERHARQPGTRILNEGVHWIEAFPETAVHSTTRGMLAAAVLRARTSSSSPVSLTS